MTRRRCLLASILLLSATASSAQIFDPSASGETAHRRTPISWNIQAGIHARLGGERYNPRATGTMGTIDMSWLRWDRENPTWGLGIHAALSDDGGPRFGPRGLYRVPLKDPGSYVQFAGGVYLVAMDKEMTSTSNYTRLNLPGYFLEAELGATSWLSVTLGAEALPLDIFETGVWDTKNADPSDSMTITNYWAGAKLGGLPGAGAIALTAVVVVIFATSFELEFE